MCNCAHMEDYRSQNALVDHIEQKHLSGKKKEIKKAVSKMAKLGLEHFSDCHKQKQIVTLRNEELLQILNDLEESAGVLRQQNHPMLHSQVSLNLKQTPISLHATRIWQARHFLLRSHSPKFKLKMLCNQTLLKFHQAPIHNQQHLQSLKVGKKNAVNQHAILKLLNFATVAKNTASLKLVNTQQRRNALRPVVVHMLQNSAIFARNIAKLKLASIS